MLSFLTPNSLLTFVLVLLFLSFFNHKNRFGDFLLKQFFVIFFISSKNNKKNIFFAILLIKQIQIHHWGIWFDNNSISWISADYQVVQLQMPEMKKEIRVCKEVIQRDQALLKRVRNKIFNLFL